MTDLRLVIFDVDGTLIDSQVEIVAAMQIAFDGAGVEMPPRDSILSIVGLSLAEAFVQLCPDTPDDKRTAMVEGYKSAFQKLRGDNREMGPLFPGAQAALDVLRGQDETLLAIATGKSRRGLDKVLERHGLTGTFHSEQVSDHHPSKPNPSMILTALNETGVAPDRAVMLGDTTFDMDMARAAGVRTIGVSWGYHDAALLRPDIMIDHFDALPAAVDQLIGQ